ncbi:MAG: hypothetical protein ACPLYF_04710 [Fervidobacterium sp.]
MAIMFVNTQTATLEQMDGLPYQISSFSVPVGTGGTYGAEQVFNPTSRAVYPQAVVITLGGTFGSGETVTTKVNFYFSDGTSNNITKSATATGTTTLTVSDWASALKDGVYITKIGVQATSSASSTSVTNSTKIIAL